ncbi:hypothetical protein JSE7799_03004 [Jannaschia seosinensis]|uniref:Uncharacterized protein n=1 Tax=Jannaschia seosinensis TaxID=313367 RepID=A0A0M7BEQ8_9RHOB|nr:hypothetical protein [Jannaschia seosinensis]CUH40272.1 hypothetical protein JSE7799_03004 [Jannaschia seosinensis]
MFARAALFLVASCGWAVLFFGGWIAWRGVTLYSNDPVLMGTGGGLAIGGLLVVGLSIGAGAQLSTARDTAAMREMMEAAQQTRPPPKPSTASGRTEPALRRSD